MQIHYDLNNFNAVDPVITVGTFDGVHLGHQKVIDELKRISTQSGGESVIFTFEPHPRIVLSPTDNSLRLLSSQQEKIELMEKSGIDHLVIYPFTKEFSQLSYRQFVTNILVGHMKLAYLVVGYDHRFGQDRRGDFSALLELSQTLNFKVEQLGELIVDNNETSSTQIRQALEAGNVDRANHLLGYHYRLSGNVTIGKQLGRKIGFPTANIEVLDHYKLVPGDGVYAVKVWVDGKLYGGMLNVGIRPTVNYNVDHKSIEVNIFDFNRDIYNASITLVFVLKIRNEQKFAGLYQLQQQLFEDKRKALIILSGITD